MSDFHEVKIGDRVKCLKFDSGPGTVVRQGAGESNWPHRVEWDDKAIGFGWYAIEELDVIVPAELEMPEEFDPGVIGHGGRDLHAALLAETVKPYYAPHDDLAAPPCYGPAPGEQTTQYVVSVPDGDEGSPLLKAHELVHGDRGRDYDHPYKDYQRTADIFRAMTGVELTVTQAVQFMIAVKLSRFQASPNVADHLIDLAGYTECLHMVRQREAILSEGGF